jgi:ribose transport system ATP-binding protein
MKEVTMRTGPALTVRRVTKRYGATLALDDVGIDVAMGEIHGLLGHNGSGKSTLIKTLAGVVTPDGGDIEVRGTKAALPITPASSHEMGLRFVHQNLGLVPALTVGENLLMDRFTAGSRRPIRWRELHRSAQALLDEYDVPVSSRARIDQVSPSAQAQVAIVRAIADRAAADNTPTNRVLILDEPTVFLPQKEVGALFALLHKLASRGDSVLLVSHRMDEVLSHTDRMTVLRNGRNVVTVAADESSEELLITHIVGAAPAAAPMPPVVAAGPNADDAPIVRLRGVSTKGVKDVDLDLRPGQIMGLTGLAGAGHEELVYALFGAAVDARGELEVDGTRVPLTTLTPVVAIRMGVGLVPADRGRQGIAGSMTVEENITITSLGRYFRRGRLRTGDMVDDTIGAVHEFDIRPPRPAVRAGQLSGGNQQRVVMAKWLRQRPRLLLLHEPTQGVDVGARAEIWSFVHAIAAGGAAVLCATTDHEELTTLATQVAVFSRGRLTRVLTGSQLTQEHISAETLVSVNGTLGGSR